MIDKRERLIEAIAGGTISTPEGYANLQRDDAENIVDAILAELTEIEGENNAF